MTTPTTPTTTRTLALAEAALRKLLAEAAQVTGEDKPEDNRLVLLSTCGWARGELLGTRRVEIDVGINNLRKVELATAP